MFSFSEVRVYTGPCLDSGSAVHNWAPQVEPGYLFSLCNFVWAIPPQLRGSARHSNLCLSLRDFSLPEQVLFRLIQTGPRCSFWRCLCRNGIFFLLPVIRFLLARKSICIKFWLVYHNGVSLSLCNQHFTLGGNSDSSKGSVLVKTDFMPMVLECLGHSQW